MRLLFRIFVVLPIALLLLLFAIANRHLITVSFDPFPGNDIDGPALTAPLFLALLMAGLAGLLFGGFVVWVRQQRWQREARYARLEASNARAEAERLRADLVALRISSQPTTGTALVPMRSSAA